MSLRSTIENARARVAGLRPNILSGMQVGQGQAMQRVQAAVNNLQSKARSVADGRPRPLQNVLNNGDALLATRFSSTAPMGGYRAPTDDGPTPVESGGYRLAT
jgi:hypothetical protein